VTRNWIGIVSVVVLALYVFSIYYPF